MDTKYTRTTITLPDWLLYEIKKKALTERKTVKELVNEGLCSFLGYKDMSDKLSLPLSSLFGAWGKGESGKSFLKRVRYGRSEKVREMYLKRLWKKS